MEKYLKSAFILIGFTSIVAQVVLIREFMIVFNGNELSLGLILGNWLLLVALGSLFLTWFSKRVNLGIKEFAVSQFFTAVILPLQIFTIRILRDILGLIQGEVVEIFPILLSTFIILMPLCIILGFQFSLACRIYSKFRKKAGAIGYVYIMEAVGSLIGGLVFSYLLIQHMNPFQIVFLLGILYLTSASSLLYLNGNQKLLPISALFITVFLLLVIPPISSQVNLSTMKMLWGDQLIEFEDSIYGNLVVLKSENQYNLYENGLLFFTTEDTALNEETVHFPMLEHPEPRRVLLIGGGISGILNEILKYPVERVTYVELDPMVIEISRSYVSYEPLNDPKVETIFTDGRFFVKTTKEKYDVIIVNLPEPSTAQLNRFYTKEFFQEVYKILDKDGIISLSVPSSESYIGKETRVLSGSIYNTLKSVFPDVRVIPGERSILLGCKSKGVLTYNPEILENRLNMGNIRNKWVTHPYIHYKLSSGRINFTLNSLSDEAEINKDIKPIGYYYYTLFWTSITDSDIRPLLKIEFWMLAVFILGMSFLISFRKRTSNIPILLAIFTTGLAGMVFEITVLLAFQSVYGYLYYKIAIIIATFMLGLALGAFLMNRYMTRIGTNTVTLAGIEFLIVTYSLILPAVIIGISQYLEIIFPLLMLIAGFLTGFEFPLASKIYLGKNRDVGKTAGIIYSSDLSGAFLGSVVSASLLIPLIGIINVCILVAILNFITGILVLKIK